jgi:hypothetical protein
MKAWLPQPPLCAHLPLRKASRGMEQLPSAPVVQAGPLVVPCPGGRGQVGAEALMS